MTGDLLVEPVPTSNPTKDDEDRSKLKQNESPYHRSWLAFLMTSRHNSVHSQLFFFFYRQLYDLEIISDIAMSFIAHQS